MPGRPESEFPPSGCRHCGLDRRLHFQRWTDAAGWHKWEHPTQEQIKARMLERRDARSRPASTPEGMSP